MPEELKISSIVIAKNEELNIKRCIESQLDVIDDIVVIVDSNTTDKTFEISSLYQKVSCEVAEWKGYAGSKNYAVSKTKYDWILWIDADEELTDELKHELNQFKKNVPVKNAYSVARRAYFLGRWIKHSGWYPSRVLRLFNKNFAKFNDKEVHENLTVVGSTGELKHDLNHYTDPSIEHYFKKFNSYTTLAAHDLHKGGKTVTMNDIIFRPLFIFFKMYIFKRGFLDGLHGFILAVFSSLYVFTKYAKLWELNRSTK